MPQGGSQGVLLACSDGQDYVVKGSHLGRVCVNEQIVGRIGMSMGAPIGEVRLVEVVQELIGANPTMSHIPSGLAHGSRSLLPDLNEDRQGLAYHDLPGNRIRFALLAVLYGWVHPNDLQYFYRKEPPQIVYSLDHGHFFHGGPQWTAVTLAAAPVPALFADIVSGCALSAAELAEAIESLQAVNPVTIAEAVAAPPDEWNFPMADRIAVAHYLYHRREQLLQQSVRS
jgi:hypothetical protein